MVWNYVNFIAMVVGYITIAVVMLIILIFIALVIREKLNDMKWRKKKEIEKQAATVAEAKPPEKGAKEAEKPNVQISIK